MQSLLHGDVGAQGAPAYSEIQNPPCLSLGLLPISREHVPGLGVVTTGEYRLGGGCPRRMVPIGPSIWRGVVQMRKILFTFMLSSRACLHFCLLTVICVASDMATVIVTVDVPEVKYLSKS